MHNMTGSRKAYRRRIRWMGLVALGICMVWSGIAAVAQSEADTGNTLRFEAEGPVRIELRDPAGNLVSRNESEIEGVAYVIEDEHATIELVDWQPGDYEVSVFASGSANRFWRFDVAASLGDQTLLLADRELIVNVPDAPFIIRVSETSIEDVTGEASTASGSSGGGGIPLLVWILGGIVILAAAGWFLFRRQKR